MKIVIAGGSGLLGAPLAEGYAEEGHDVRVLTRALPPGESRHDAGTGVPGVTRAGWTPDGKTGAWATVVDGADAVVNLAGEPIDRERWSPRRKALLRDSRLLATRSIVAAIRSARVAPRVLVNASAVGYYGATGDEPLTEASPAGSDFLAHLCQDWEREATGAEASGTRVVPLRTGVVLERSGGALPRMLLPYRLFVGGPLGSGRQYFSWIHRLDWLELVRWIVQTPEAAGPINATAPQPVTSRQLASAIGRATRRPSLLPVPAFALRLALGEFAESLVTGQRVMPARALELGYRFRYPDLEQALRGLL